MEKDNKRFLGIFLSGISVFGFSYFEWKNTLNLKEYREIKKDLVQPVDLRTENEGKPVYANGLILVRNREELKDDIFKIAQLGLRLIRKVEMLQYSIEKSNLEMIWSENKLENENLPEDKQSPAWKFKAKTFNTSLPYYVTPLLVGEEILDYINTVWTIKPVVHNEIFAREMKKKGFAIYYDQDYYYLSRFIRKKNVFKPRFGDYRIKYSYIPEQIYVSMIGEQRNGKIVPYKDKIFIAQEGKVLPSELLRKYEEENYDNI